MKRPVCQVTYGCMIMLVLRMTHSRNQGQQPQQLRLQPQHQLLTVAKIRLLMLIFDLWYSNCAVGIRVLSERARSVDMHKHGKKGMLIHHGG